MQGWLEKKYIGFVVVNEVLRDRLVSCTQAVEAMGELLRTLVGSGWCAEWTRRCGAHFRKLPAPMWKDGVYQEVMGLLVERGLGEVREQLWEDEVQDVFVKGCFSDLTKEAKDALKEMGVPGWSFGPPCKADAAQSQTCPRWGGKVRRQQCRLWMVMCSGCFIGRKQTNG